MAKRICDVPGCENVEKARGWCSKHYQRWHSGRPMEDPVRQEVCSLPDCKRPFYGRGFCYLHWTRWRTHGDPEKVTYIKGPFWERVDRRDDQDCWEWTGSRNRHGYGAFRRDGVRKLAHVYAYEEMVGPVPDGLELDPPLPQSALRQPEPSGAGHAPGQHAPQPYGSVGCPCSQDALQKRPSVQRREHPHRPAWLSGLQDLSPRA